MHLEKQRQEEHAVRQILSEDLGELCVETQYCSTRTRSE
jgi:hypothetical protein